MVIHMIDVIPGIYDDTEAEIRRKLDLVAPYVPWVQLDMSDGTLVVKKSVTDVHILKNIISSYPHLSFEAHLMVAKPGEYVRKLSDAGFKRVIAHVECTDLRVFLDEVQYEEMEVVLAIDGPTEIDQIEPYLEEVDAVLVMTIEMGDSGKPFLPETVEKIRQIREGYPDLPIEVDGGMNEATAKVVRDAGATRIAATNFFFVNHPKSIAHAVKLLSGI